MKKIYIIFLLFPIIVYGQNLPGALSLKDAIQRALIYRYDLKIQKETTSISQKQLSEVLTRNLPQISSDLDLRYNSELQTNILPSSFFGSNSSDRPVQFGTKYANIFGLNLTEQIFNPSNLSDRKIAANQIQYQKQNEKLTEINIKQEVTEAYFTALLWKEKVDLAQENVNRSQEAYQVAKDQLTNAQATLYDVQRNLIDLENAKATYEQNNNSYKLSMKDLLYKISDETLKNLILTDNIADLLESFRLSPNNNEEIKRVELIQENIQLETYRLNVRQQKLNHFPSISLYGNYSLQFLNNDFTPFTASNWYPFNYFGIKANMPIFDGGLKTKTKQEYELKMELCKDTYNKLKKDYQEELQSTQTALNNALSDVNYQKKNLSLIESLYKIDADRLKNGTIKQNDLTTTLYTLKQTQTNYLNAVYNYLVAVVRYKKAAGVL